jgi:dienelactone hydrolase
VNELDWEKIVKSQILWVIIGFTVGLSVIWWPMLNGSSLFGALFVYIVASIQYAMAARGFVGWVAFLAIILVGMAAITGRNLRSEPAEQAYKLFTSFVIGWGFSRAIIYFLLDSAFFRGSIAILPFMFGAVLLAGVAGNLTINASKLKGEITPTTVIRKIPILTVLLVSLVLTLPNLVAVAGLLPTPPERPTEGYGSADSPYEVQEFSLTPEYPKNMTGWWDDWAQEQEWKVYVFVPVGLESESAGVAVYLHGYQGEKIEYYRDTMMSLAGQGLVTIFPQYVSDMDLSSIPADFELNYTLGGSDHPQHLPRYTMALYGVEAGLDFIAADGGVNQVLGETKLDKNHMWIGGHSMGAGTTFYVMSELLGRGFGSDSLVVDLEAPWIHATQVDLMGNMSQLPDHTLIHVVEYEDDFVVEKCIGRWQHARLTARDQSPPLPSNQVLFLQVPSDFNGFPRLMASHYLPSGFVRDSLADHSYYPRLEAQSDFVASSAFGDMVSADTAKSWFMTEGEMTDLGSWSDGVAVKPMTIVSSPLELTDENFDACPVP